MEGRRTEAVIDSSVAVKWFSQEEGADTALALKSQHVKSIRPIWVSDLLYHEVANALRHKPDYDEKKLATAVQNLFGLHLNTWPADPTLMQKASTIAYQSEVTIYDAIPVALAQLRGTTCITADEQTQYKKAKAQGYPVTLLSKE